MPNLLVRGAGPQDAQTYADWLQSTPSNLYDPAVYQYPTCVSLVVEKESPVLMNSTQAVLVWEALAVKPGLSPLTEARALKALNTAWTNIATATGIKEMYFTCADERIGNFVTKHGWERLPHPVYRIKL